MSPLQASPPSARARCAIRMEGVEEHVAGLAGLQLVMVVTTTIVTALLALDIGVAG